MIVLTKVIATIFTSSHNFYKKLKIEHTTNNRKWPRRLSSPLQQPSFDGPLEVLQSLHSCTSTTSCLKSPCTQPLVWKKCVLLLFFLSHTCNSRMCVLHNQISCPSMFSHTNVTFHTNAKLFAFPCTLRRTILCPTLSCMYSLGSDCELERCYQTSLTTNFRWKN